jgi:hypothetical protein
VCFADSPGLAFRGRNDKTNPNGQETHSRYRRSPRISFMISILRFHRRVCIALPQFLRNALSLLPANKRGRPGSLSPSEVRGLSATRKLITDIGPEGRYSKDNFWGISCVRFAHSSDIFPDVDDLRGAAWLRYLYSCSEICPCHIDPRCRIGTSSSTF